MTSYNFVRFLGTSERENDFFSLVQTNSLGISKGCIERNNLGQFSYVILFYDHEKVAIGLHFVKNRNAKGSFKVTHDKRGKGGSISCTSFLKANRIDSKKFAGKYAYSVVEEPGIGRIFVIDLKENNA